MRRKVKRIIDGDTFETYTRVNGTNKVRIADYDAPESYQYGGQRATNRLRGLIGGKTVTLVPKARSYNRIVADVRLNRRSVAKKLKRM